MDRAAFVATPAQVPVVVFGCARLVVRDQVVIARAFAAAGRVPAGTGTPARPRSVIASRRRKRRKPLSPALPMQVGQSCAQPSMSSEPRHVWAVPHHRQSNVARNGTLDQASTGVQLPGGPLSTNASGSKISARSSMPSNTRGPGRLK